ncbi:hypothetical protein LE181_02450 [Streptomyces sp. SCA3-4]|uniref:hypothetical protein n=1 Tax=Streptomyces sichuanensis TaxID=2871810 RepID=UPI001CE2C64F|nr:hypothetical protein [Streptomyces sichuanensis]MCA6091032.1 hypothetical protein [Streptomyces sichuanensis]
MSNTSRSSPAAGEPPDGGDEHQGGQRGAEGDAQVDGSVEQTGGGSGVLVRDTGQRQVGERAADHAVAEADLHEEEPAQQAVHRLRGHATG